MRFMFGTSLASTLKLSLIFIVSIMLVTDLFVLC